jgi:hypothetical protein
MPQPLTPAPTEDALTQPDVQSQVPTGGDPQPGQPATTGGVDPTPGIYSAFDTIPKGVQSAGDSALDPDKTVDQNADTSAEVDGERKGLFYTIRTKAGKVVTIPIGASYAGSKWLAKKTYQGIKAAPNLSKATGGVSLGDIGEIDVMRSMHYEESTRPIRRDDEGNNLRDIKFDKNIESQQDFNSITNYLYEKKHIGPKAKAYLDNLTNNIQQDISQGLVSSPKEHPDYEEFRASLDEYAYNPKRFANRAFTVQEPVTEDELSAFEVGIARLQNRSITGESTNVLEANQHRAGDLRNLPVYTELTNTRVSWEGFLDGLGQSAELMGQAYGLRKARSVTALAARSKMLAGKGALKWGGRAAARTLGLPLLIGEGLVYAQGAADDWAMQFHPDYGRPWLRSVGGVDPISVTPMYNTYQLRPDAKREYLDWSKQVHLTEETYDQHQNKLLNGIPYTNFHVWQLVQDTVDPNDPTGSKRLPLQGDAHHLKNRETGAQILLADVEQLIPGYASKYRVEVDRDILLNKLRLAESVQKDPNFDAQGRTVISDEEFKDQRAALKEMTGGFTEHELMGFDKNNPIPNVAGFDWLRPTLEGLKRPPTPDYERRDVLDYASDAVNWGLGKLSNLEDVPRNYLANEELTKSMNNKITLTTGFTDKNGQTLPPKFIEEAQGRNIGTDAYKTGEFLWGTLGATDAGKWAGFDSLHDIKDKYKVIHRDIARDSKSPEEINSMRSNYYNSYQVQKMNQWQQPEVYPPQEQPKKKKKRQGLSNPFDAGLLGPQDWMNR